MTEIKIKGNIPETKIEKYKLCPACGNYCSVQEDQNYCIVCGKKMIESCGKCGEPIIYPTAKYCHKCGAGYKKENQNSKK